MGNILGKLEEDSPALSGLIRRQLGYKSLPRLRAIYELGFSLSGFSESEITRGEGVSFNPKPARICDLVSKDRVEETLLGAAILSCAVKENDIEANFHEEMVLAKEAQKISLGKVTSTDPSANLLALALTLDRVRHLHMSNFSSIEKKEILLLAHKLLSSIPGKLQLKILLSSAIEKVSIEE